MARSNQLELKGTVEWIKENGAFKEIEPVGFESRQIGDYCIETLYFIVNDARIGKHYRSATFVEGIFKDGMIIGNA